MQAQRQAQHNIIERVTKICSVATWRAEIVGLGLTFYKRYERPCQL